MFAHEQGVQPARIVSGDSFYHEVAFALVKANGRIVIDRRLQVDERRARAPQLLFGCMQQRRTYALPPRLGEHVDGDNVSALPTSLTHDESQNSGTAIRRAGRPCSHFRSLDALAFCQQRERTGPPHIEPQFDPRVCQLRIKASLVDSPERVKVRFLELPKAKRHAAIVAGLATGFAPRCRRLKNLRENIGNCECISQPPGSSNEAEDEVRQISARRLWAMRLFLTACAMSLSLLAGAQNNSPMLSPQTVGVATVQGELEGARVAVFETPAQSCNSNDVPDAMARAFRDYTGAVHLVAASAELFQSIGPTLDSVQHSCEIGHQSAGDPDPANFNDQTWIDSFYTFDGKKIAGLTHTEYHGWAHPGKCRLQNGYSECEYDSDTYHLSMDGGYHFFGFKAPANFVAGVPYQYQIDRGPSGHSVDSNIIAWDGWYYAMVTSYAWPPNCTGQKGPQRCLVAGGGSPMRTTDVFDATSWRGWSGTDFSVSFADPYPGPVHDRREHVYTPVQYMDVVTAVNIFASGNVVVATLWDPWDHEYGEKGLYLSTSTDMVHWTKPRLVAHPRPDYGAGPAGKLAICLLFPDRSRRARFEFFCDWR